MKTLIITFIVLLSAISISAKDKNIDTLRVTTIPQMSCGGCANNIKSNIRFVKGVKQIETSVQEQKVTIIYDNRKSKYKDFEDAFEKIGYKIKLYKEAKPKQK